MKITDLFIKRPVLAMVVNLVVLIAGLQAIRTLTVRQFPRSDMANVVVRTAYVGANADLVRGFITAPLERAIAGAEGIDLEKLVACAREAQRVLGRPLGSHVLTAGPVDWRRA